MAKFCTWCGSLIDEADKFCGSCGKEVIKKYDEITKKDAIEAVHNILVKPANKENHTNETKLPREKLSSKKSSFSKPEIIFWIVVAGVILIFIISKSISEQKFNPISNRPSSNQTPTDTPTNFRDSTYKTDTTKRTADTGATEPTADTTITNNNYSNQPQNNSDLIVNGFNITDDFNGYHVTVNLSHNEYCIWCNKVRLHCDEMSDYEIHQTADDQRIQRVLLDYSHWDNQKNLNTSFTDYNRILIYFNADSQYHAQTFNRIVHGMESIKFLIKMSVVESFEKSTGRKSKEISIDKYSNCGKFCSLKCQNEYEEKYGKSY